MVPKVKRGDIVDVKITGIQPYGAFASLPDNSTGLIHISEISDKFVKSIDMSIIGYVIIKTKALPDDSYVRRTEPFFAAINSSDVDSSI